MSHSDYSSGFRDLFIVVGAFCLFVGAIAGAIIVLVLK